MCLGLSVNQTSSGLNAFIETEPEVVIGKRFYNFFKKRKPLATTANLNLAPWPSHEMEHLKRRLEKHGTNWHLIGSHMADKSPQMVYNAKPLLQNNFCY